jgi:5'-3' exonuclease
MKDYPELNEEYIRHMVLNTYRKYNSEFRGEYGQLVICNDSSNCWRKKIFPQYKQNRKKSQSNSDMDWDAIYDSLHKIRSEIREVFPYKSVTVETTEADDIIFVLAKHFHKMEKILILSNDKDFMQLGVFENVFQYSPLKKSYISTGNPKMFLLEHIARGDSSDGVPNILSDDDTFMNEEKSQKRLTTKVMSKVMDDIVNNRIQELPFYDRNKSIIDLSCIPVDLEEKILEEFEKPTVGSKTKVMSYMIEKKLKNLIENIEDF